MKARDHGLPTPGSLPTRKKDLGLAGISMLISTLRGAYQVLVVSSFRTGGAWLGLMSVTYIDHLTAKLHSDLF